MSITIDESCQQFYLNLDNSTNKNEANFIDKKPKNISSVSENFSKFLK